MPSTQARLRAVLRDGNFTRPELAAWFGVPYQTVRGWLEHNRKPSGPPQDVQHTMNVLALTEALIAKCEGLPVPRLPRKARTAYLKKLHRKMFPWLASRPSDITLGTAHDRNGTTKAR